MENLSAAAIEMALTNLADPKVNSRIDLASTPYVAAQIINSLPGVKELTENGPAVADAVLSRLNDDQVLDDEYFSSIGLHILSHYPSERVKRALAGPIVERKFSGFSSQFAAQAFLRAAGIDAKSEKAIATALREARKLVVPNAPKVKGGGQTQARAGGRPSLKKNTAPADGRSRSQKKKSSDRKKPKSPKR